MKCRSRRRGATEENTRQHYKDCKHYTHAQRLAERRAAYSKRKAFTPIRLAGDPGSLTSSPSGPQATSLSRGRRPVGRALVSWSCGAEGDVLETQGVNLATLSRRAPNLSGPPSMRGAAGNRTRLCGFADRRVTNPPPRLVRRLIPPYLRLRSAWVRDDASGR